MFVAFRNTFCSQMLVLCIFGVNMFAAFDCSIWYYVYLLDLYFLLFSLMATMSMIFDRKLDTWIFSFFDLSFEIVCECVWVCVLNGHVSGSMHIYRNITWTQYVYTSLEECTTTTPYSFFRPSLRINWNLRSFWHDELANTLRFYLICQTYNF